MELEAAAFAKPVCAAAKKRTQGARRPIAHLSAGPRSRGVTSGSGGGTVVARWWTWHGGGTVVDIGDFLVELGSE